jgi:hypothetical protein
MSPAEKNRVSLPGVATLVEEGAELTRDDSCVITRRRVATSYCTSRERGTLRGAFHGTLQKRQKLLMSMKKHSITRPANGLPPPVPKIFTLLLSRRPGSAPSVKMAIKMA